MEASPPTGPFSNGPLSNSDQIRYAREIIRMEGQALASVAARLGQEFCRAVEIIHACRGSAIVTGMGKAGLIGQKIAATLASTGTRSHFLHPSEAQHGDLGRIHRGDIALVLSQSGETEEIVRLLPSLAELGTTIIAISGTDESTLGNAALVVLTLGPLKEACALGLAPSSSTTAMLALGDALALVASRMRGFGREDFARFHPGGNLGRQLSRVEDHMRTNDECRIANQNETLRDVLLSHSRRSATGRRTGAIMITGEEGRFVGFFTDSDLAKLFERRQWTALDEPIRHVMTRNPVVVPSGSMTADAVMIMAERKISELPVVDEYGRPAGMLDITDLVNRDLVTGSPPRDDRAAAVVEPSPESPRQTAQSEPAGSKTPVPRPKMIDYGELRTPDNA